MTESVNEFSEIFLQIKNLNPKHTNDEIYNELGKLITDFYIREINTIRLTQRLDKFQRAKLKIQRQRHSERGKGKLDKRFKKDKIKSDYQSIKKAFKELSTFNSSDIGFKVDNLMENENSSETFFKDVKTNVSDKNELAEYKSFEKRKTVISDFLENFKDNSSFLRKNVPIEYKNLTPLKPVDDDKKKRNEVLKSRFNEKVEEPVNFYIASDTHGLLLNSKDNIEDLLKELENTNFNKVTAEKYSQFNNIIEDLTDN